MGAKPGLVGEVRILTVFDLQRDSPSRQHHGDQGVLVRAMRRHWLLLAAVFTILTVVDSSAFAQDALASIIKKSDLTQRDRARIEAEVPQRVKRLEEAGTDDKARERARDRLISTAKTDGATKAGLDAYAAAVSSAIEPLTKTKTSTLGMDVLDILIDLNNPNTCTALATALESNLPEVRYRAARGIQRLHKEIAASDRFSRTVLSALGNAGKKEDSDLTLRMIYEAINFQADVEDFRYRNYQADALVDIFDARIARMQSAAIDQFVDLIGVETAAKAYTDADARQRTRLISDLLIFLDTSIARYFAGDTSDEARPMIARLVQQIENGMHEMIGASGSTPPREKIGDALRGGGDLDTKRQSMLTARDALLQILRGDPWRIR